MPKPDEYGAKLPNGPVDDQAPKDPPASTDAPAKLDPPAPVRPGFAKPTDDQLAHRYKHHPPQGNQVERYGEIRQAVLECAIKIRDRTPCSPEQSRALNALDDAMMLANAAIARNEPRQ